MERISINLPTMEKTRKTEYGELVKEFAGKMGWTIPRTAKFVQGIKIPALYSLQKNCAQAEAKGIKWQAAFQTSVKQLKVPR